jgi:hypothetical protein
MHGWLFKVLIPENEPDTWSIADFYAIRIADQEEAGEAVIAERGGVRDPLPEVVKPVSYELRAMGLKEGEFKQGKPFLK